MNGFKLLTSNKRFISWGQYRLHLVRVAIRGLRGLITSFLQTATSGFAFANRRELTLFCGESPSFLVQVHTQMIFEGELIHLEFKISIACGVMRVCGHPRMAVSTGPENCHREIGKYNFRCQWN